MALALLCLVRPASAAPWMWDQDTDGIDDRLEAVAQNGITYAYENLDTDGRLRFEVQLVGNLLQYGAYLRYDHNPTPADSVTATLLGAQVITRFLSVPYMRVRAFYPTLLTLNARPEIDRIESVSLFYIMNWKEGHAIGVRKAYGAPFPTLEDETNPTGVGSIVAILDTGINDTPQASYPGHLDVAGKILGGANYGGTGPSGFTWWTGSVNPSQIGVGVLSYHATHLAGTIAGASRSRTFGGIAPAARLVDVKVLSDDGTGDGLCEGIEWCIQNRARNWGGGNTGIDILNISVSGTDLSDGQDCACALVNQAVIRGLTVVCSMGNDGTCGYVPSPAAADGAIAVGAASPGATADETDDTLASFSNEGPRSSDGDGSLLDEMKPDIVAPGVDVISASGSPVESPYHYRSLSGTSMSTALVSGTLALLLQGNGALTPAQMKQILHDTSLHKTGSPHVCSQGQDPYSLDSRYHSGWGWGELDALAAWEEVIHPSATQYVRLKLDWDGSSSVVHVAWTTQRERPSVSFLVQRAPDVGGAPGTFVTVSPAAIPAVGPSNLNGSNRTTYLVDDAAPANGIFWYRIITMGGGLPDTSIATSVRTEVPVAIAITKLSHNTPETDLAMTIGSGNDPGSPNWVKPLTMANAIAVSMPFPDTGTNDNMRYTFYRPIYATDGAGTYLPPAQSRRWFFNVLEDGDALRTGTLDDYEIDTPGGNYDTDTTVPKLTTENNNSTLWIPEAAISGVVDGDASLRKQALSARPNPFRGATRIELRIDSTEHVRLSVLDVQGREVRVVTDEVLSPGTYSYGWDGRDDRGRSRPAGHYYLRLARAYGNQVIPLVYLD